jgi:hypothetical protein
MHVIGCAMDVFGATMLVHRVLLATVPANGKDSRLAMINPDEAMRICHFFSSSRCAVISTASRLPPCVP